MVVETGMGGRLDSTNVLNPLVSVITLIELEHTAILGNTIAAIAGEKAGIIKKSKPLVLAKQCEEALEVFRKKAKEQNSPLYYYPEIAELSNINITPQGTEFTLAIKESLLISYSLFLISNLKIPVPGKVQAENASLAITAVKLAFPEIDEKTICKGLQNLKIPGRFEKIKPSQEIFQQLYSNTDSISDSFPPFIIDGAHTPESLTLCVETFNSLYGEGGILLFGCAADKDAAKMAEIAFPHFSKIIITTPGTFKISNPQKVYEAFSKHETNEHKTLELIKDTQEAIKQAILSSCRRTGGNSLPILGTGSFYLVSEIRKFTKNY